MHQLFRAFCRPAASFVAIFIPSLVAQADAMPANNDPRGAISGGAQAY